MLSIDGITTVHSEKEIKELNRVYLVSNDVKSSSIFISSASATDDPAFSVSNLTVFSCSFSFSTSLSLDQLLSLSDFDISASLPMFHSGLQI